MDYTQKTKAAIEFRPGSKTSVPGFHQYKGGKELEVNPSIQLFGFNDIARLSK